MTTTTAPIVTDVAGATIQITTRALADRGTLVRVGIDDGDSAVKLLLTPEQTCTLIAALADAWAEAARRGPAAAGPKCDECGRVFDLADANDAADWSFGHDCEA